MRRRIGSWLYILTLGFASCFALAQAAAAPVTLYSAAFEPAEGFNASLPLTGQQGWTNFGSGGNGIVSNFFAGGGQQAFIGFAPPSAQDSILNVWRPLNSGLAPASHTVVRFTVSMAVFSSSNGRHDDFRWSVYNTNNGRLFTLDFDANSMLISYSLDDGLGFRSSGFQFARDTLYTLVVTMNLAQNAWSATMGGVPIVASLPLTTTSQSRSVADVDAVWAIRTAGSPGDNFLAFDDYSIVAEEPASSVLSVGLLSVANGAISFRVQGQQAVRYAIDVTTNIVAPSWVGLVTNSSDNGQLDFNDPAPAVLARRFYRARQVP
jgi:hypothetical protein